MYTQILLHTACETLWEPEGAWQSPCNTRPGCSQAASVTAQDGSPGPAQPQHWVRTKPTKPCPRAGSWWCLEASRYSGWHCSHTAECFVQQLQYDLIFFFLLTHFTTMITFLSKLHCLIYANTDPGSQSYHYLLLPIHAYFSHFQLNNATLFTANVSNTQGGIEKSSQVI